jgi:hypothetical protein
MGAIAPLTAEEKKDLAPVVAKFAKDLWKLASESDVYGHAWFGSLALAAEEDARRLAQGI